MNIAQFPVCAVLVAVSIVSCNQDSELQSQQAADWILTGGKFFTVDDRQPWAQTIAIKDGRFIYVGSATAAALRRYLPDICSEAQESPHCRDEASPKWIATTFIRSNHLP